MEISNFKQSVCGLVSPLHTFQLLTNQHEKYVQNFGLSTSMIHANPSILNHFANFYKLELLLTESFQ